MLPQIFFF